MKRKLFILLIMVGGTYFMTSCYLLSHKDDWLIYYHDSIETLSFIAVIISTVFVAWQIRLFIRDYTHKNERAEFEQSYEMAKFYAENLLPKIPPILRFLNKMNRHVIPNYEELQRSIQKQELRFTSTEASELLVDGCGELFLTTIRSEIPLNDLADFFSEFEGKTIYEIKKDWKELLATASEEDIHNFYKQKSYLLRQKVADVFNDLEYFSMVFCSGLAIPENVYASLHQTFMDFTSKGYLFIASRNNAPGHEYYTHIIDLRNPWYLESEKIDMRLSLRALSARLGYKLYTNYKREELAKPKKLNKK